MKFPIVSLLVSLLLITSCTNINQSMREPQVLVEMGRDDFELSEQVMGTAVSKKILGIDFQCLFKKNTGEIEDSRSINYADIPVIGNIVVDKTANYALYEIMMENKGYDVVFYPQYHTTVDKPFIGLGFIYKKTTVQVKARLGKLKRSHDIHSRLSMPPPFDTIYENFV